MGAESFIAFLRMALLYASFGLIIVSCAAAALARREGAVGAAVRIVATMLAPATAFAFLGVLLWPVTLSASVAAALWQGRGCVPAVSDRVRAIWSSTSLVSKVSIVALVVAIAFRAGTALALPPTDGDSLLYHLPITAVLIQDHTMWFTRALLYPGAVELGEAVAGAITGNVSGVIAFEMMQVLALILVGYGWARRAGASQDGAVATAVVAGALPIAVDQMFTSQIDIFVCAMLAAACALWRPAPRLAAIAIGLLFAAKATAFLLVPAVGVVMLAFEGWPFSLIDVTWACALAAPWYIRTWALSGRPIDTVAVMGWSSTIAAHFVAVWPFMVAALRSFGGFGAFVGIIALAYAATRRDRTRFARAIPWLAAVAFIAWTIMPTAAENVPNTLDQIREGWSIRYLMLLPFILATALPIVADRLTPFPIAGFVALIAAASAVVRSANLTSSQTALGFAFALPLLVVVLLLAFAIASRYQVVRMLCLASALTACALVTVAGARSFEHYWNATYIQWSPHIPANDAYLDPHVVAGTKVGIIGMRSFPLVGPDFSRRTYEQILKGSAAQWLDQLRHSEVHVLLAAGLSGSPDQPGFGQPLLAERAIQALPGVCLLAVRGTARVYGLDGTACVTAPSL